MTRSRRIRLFAVSAAVAAVLPSHLALRAQVPVQDPARRVGAAARGGGPFEASPPGIHSPPRPPSPRC